MQRRTKAGAFARSTDDDRNPAMTAAADRHLVFGLLAFENGLINQGRLVVGSQACSRDRSKSLADQVVARMVLDADFPAGRGWLSA